MKTERQLKREQRIANKDALQARCELLRQKANALYVAYEENPTEESKRALDDNARELVLVVDLIARGEFGRSFYIFDSRRIQVR